MMAVMQFLSPPPLELHITLDYAGQNDYLLNSEE